MKACDRRRQPLRQFLRWTQMVLLAGAVAMCPGADSCWWTAGLFSEAGAPPLRAAAGRQPQTPSGMTPAYSVPPSPAATGRTACSAASPFRVSVFPRSSWRAPAIRLSDAPSAILPAPLCPAAREHRHFRPPGHVLPAAAKHPAGRHHHSHYAARRVPLSGRVHQGGQLPTMSRCWIPAHLEILTLVTCYPFYFVGSAPDRFIVRAERVDNIS